MSTIPNYMLEQVRLYGPAGLVHKATAEDSCYVAFELGTFHTTKEPSPYYTLMTQILKEHPRLERLLVKYYVLEEICGYNPVYESPTYTLSFPGIRRALDLLQVQAIVTDSFELLKEAFAALRGRVCMVCDGGLLMEQNKPKGHAISLFVENSGDRFSLCINDSYGIAAAYKQENFQELFPEGATVDLCISRVQRQKIGEPTCSAFAIEDCRVFQENPHVIDEELTMRGSSLPSSMMTFAEENGSLALEKAIEHQLLVMNEGPVLERF